MWNWICQAASWVGSALTQIGAQLTSPLGMITFTQLDALDAAIADANATASEASAAASAAINAKNAKLVDPGFKVIGLRYPRLVTNPDTFTQTKFDYSSYPDRAIVTITNSTGVSLNCCGISIQGKCVVQHDGAYQWDYSNYASIERDGERSIEIANDFIMDSEQVESLGDYIQKEMAAHSMYQLHINGCAYNYEIGDIWHLTISYLINGQVSEAENIDVDVEITRAHFSRRVGSPGETILDVRVPSGAWSKTTSRRARLISAGAANWLNNRGNVITVAASDFTGQADYFCDGANDDTEIQAAIDNVAAIGGGVVQLTPGTFVVGLFITIKENVTLRGVGAGTVVRRSTTNGSTIIDMSSYSHSSLTDICIDGTGYTYTEATIALINGSGSTGTFCHNVTISNFTISKAYAGTIFVYCFYNIYDLSNCYVNNILATNTSQSVAVYGYAQCSRGVQCAADNITSIAQPTYYATSQGFALSSFLSSCKALTMYAGGGGTLNKVGFSACNNITICESTNAEANAVGFAACTSMQQNKATTATKYSGCFADSASLVAVADTAAGGYNS